MVSLPRFWGSRNPLKPCIWSAPYLVMVKSDMAAKRGRNIELVVTFLVVGVAELPSERVQAAATPDFCRLESMEISERAT